MNTARVIDEIEFIRLPEVLRITGLSRSTLYDKIEAKTFPRQVNLGGKAVAWVKSEVQDWAKSLVEARGG